MSLARGGVQPRPQLAYAYTGTGTANPAGSNPVASATLFAAAGAPQPFLIVPANWQ